MDFTGIIKDLEQNKLAARRYQKEGHVRFRDSVTIGRNGKVLFERFNYGEAAGKVCAMWADGIGEDGTIRWKYDEVDYSKKDEAPVRLTGIEGDALAFDDKKLLWREAASLKHWPEGGLGRLKMVFSK